jgi:hypothetical protein
MLTSRRIGGFAGLLFLGTVLPVNLILGSAGMPQAGADRADVLEFFGNSSGAVDLGSALAPIAWITLVLFAAGVHAAIRPHEHASGDSWSLAGLGGVVMQCAIFPGVVATQVALNTGTLSDDAAWALWLLHNALFTLNVMALAIVLVSFTIGGWRAGLVTRWHRVVGLVAAAALAATAILTPLSVDGSPVMLLGLLGFLLWLVWIGAMSRQLLRAPVMVDAATAVPASVSAR